MIKFKPKGKNTGIEGDSPVLKKLREFYIKGIKLKDTKRENPNSEPEIKKDLDSDNLRLDDYQSSNYASNRSSSTRAFSKGSKDDESSDKKRKSRYSNFRSTSTKTLKCKGSSDEKSIKSSEFDQFNTHKIKDPVQSEILTKYTKVSIKSTRPRPPIPKASCFFSFLACK